MRQRCFRVTMSLRELDRLRVIQAVADRELHVRSAAERMQMSAQLIQMGFQSSCGNGNRPFWGPI